MRTPNITSRQKFITLALSTGKNTLTRQEIKFICDENKLGYPIILFYICKELKTILWET